jgi:hypothetical protein
MKRIILLLVLILSLVSPSTAQDILRQNVRGEILDRDTRKPLIGATIQISGQDTTIASLTDIHGKFRIEGVPVGRYRIQISYMGYKPQSMDNVLVTSSKELILRIELIEDAFTTKSTTIKRKHNKAGTGNKMSLVSSRSFSVEETRRYAGGLDDPSRMASAFGGVNASSDLGDNSIVIRGNSPRGLIWMIEGIEVPNPNHFAEVGTTGGGISIISSQLLDNSDFYTAAFPAEYGNALSGVFDVRLKQGNDEKKEYTVQAGIQGIDLAAEGPFKKGSESTYVVNYRYSSLALLEKVMNTFDGIPVYQDLSFKTYMPTKKYGNFSVWGIAGMSETSEKPSKDSSEWVEEYDNYEFVFGSNMAAGGVKHKIGVGERGYLESNIAMTSIKYFEEYGFLNEQLNYVREFEKDITKTNVILSTKYNRKHSRRLRSRSGLNYTKRYFDLYGEYLDDSTKRMVDLFDDDGSTGSFQAFSQWRYSLSKKVKLIGGVHFTHFDLNSNYSIDPRAAIKWKLNKKSEISAGYGKHSKLEDVTTYLGAVETGVGEYSRPNRQLELSKAHHFVAGYDYLITKNLRLKLEGYYQHLYDIPVEENDVYSSINSQNSLYIDSFVNDGTGKNMGFDITVERFFTGSYYFLTTLSVYDSKYKGGDGVERNTLFNGNYLVNALGGKEFYLGKGPNKKIFGVNVRTQISGGRRYTPVDLSKSIRTGDTEYDESRAFELRLPNFMNVDLTLTLRKNRKKYSSVWALQLKNVTSSKPVYGYDYNSDTGEIEEDRIGPGILPFLSYKVEF